MENESLVMFRDSARDFLQAADQRQRVRRLEEAGGGFDRGTWGSIAELGWLSVLVPEADGGLGLGIAEVAAIAEEAGRQLLPEPFVDAGVHPLALLARLPAGGVRDALLGELQSGGKVAGVAWQEQAGELEPHGAANARPDAAIRRVRSSAAHQTHGAQQSCAPYGAASARRDDTASARRDDTASARCDDTASARRDDTASARRDDISSARRDDTASARRDATASARPDGASLRVTGEKRFVRPGPGADGWIVSAQLEGQAALCWVDAAAAGLDVRHDIGVDGSAIATLALQDAPATLLAQGDVASAALQQANELARIAQAAELAGIAARALELTRDYLTTRVQFGKPIGSFQALQHRMVDALIQVELAKACLREGLASTEDAALARTASRLQARCGHAAAEVTRMAIQLHGAIGTTNEYDVGLYFKRALALCARWGNPAAHRRRWSALARATAQKAAPVAAREYNEFPPHQDWENMPEAEFRQLVRALFARHYPEHRRYMPYRQSWAESKDWYMTLARLGWLAPAWPREHGGMGLPPDKLIAYIEESEAWGVARPPDQGLVMVGPILMRFGTPAQRERFLPKVLAGEHVWTQGYSEPNAGSDLAAVRTEAVRDGDHFIVNGQKTWTTWGADGTHMFMLVRTDKTVKKQAGISFLLVDLKTPGITVRPIRNIAGEQEFCEVFFDDVRVPVDNLVGELNQGWTIAKALLGFERLFTGSPKHSQHTMHQVEKLARQRGLLDDPVFAARLAELQLDTADLGAAYAGFAAIAKRGETIPPTISMLKIWSTETYERLALLLVESAQDYGAFRDHCRSDEIDMHVVAPLFNCLGAKIFAGSNEIQRNILAKAVLDLPT